MKTYRKFHKDVGTQRGAKVFIALILVQLILAAFQVWNVIAMLKPEPLREIACFDGYELGVQVGDELVPLALAPGEGIDPQAYPMVAIYGTYCSEVVK